MKKIVILTSLLLCILLLMLFNVNQIWVSIIYWITMMGIVITMLYLLIGKRWTQCVFLFLLIFLILYSFYLLGIQVPPVFREVLDSRSESVSESKEAKSFICSYSSLYNSKHNIMIKESFAEYRHEYKNYYSREFRIDKNSIWFVARIDNLDAMRKNGYEETCYFIGDNYFNNSKRFRSQRHDSNQQCRQSDYHDFRYRPASYCLRQRWGADIRLRQVCTS